MATSTLRFSNFIIDTTIYLTITICFFMLFRNTIGQKNVQWISILFYFLYYFLFEYFKGQTIGKIITKSRVTPFTDNKNYYLIRIFGRTVMRFIPLDILSYLISSRGLHDWISHTKVIKL